MLHKKKLKSSYTCVYLPNLPFIASQVRSRFKEKMGAKSYLFHTIYNRDITAFLASWRLKSGHGMVSVDCQISGRYQTLDTKHISSASLMDKAYRPIP